MKTGIARKFLGWPHHVAVLAVALLVVVTGGIAAAPPACACSCGEPDLLDWDVVFSGVPTHEETIPAEDGDHSVYSFDIKAVYTEPSAGYLDTTATVDAGAQECCVCGATFSLNQEVLVYASALPAGEIASTSTSACAPGGWLSFGDGDLQQQTQEIFGPPRPL